MNRLTVGMATYDNHDGVWLTLANLRGCHPQGIEVVVIDNTPRGCDRTRNCVHAHGGRYYHKPNLHGTSAPRDEVFRLAETPWVVCCDDHVQFESGALDGLIRYAESHPDSRDLIQGPLVYDDGSLSTHWRPTTGPGLWGVWDRDERVQGQDTFEIPMQGLGVWAMRREVWPGFNPLFTGFGGEEGYLHELVRRLGGKALCLPALRWRHLFRDPRKAPPYPLSLEDHAWNLLVGHRELGIDATDAIRKDFGNRLPPGLFDALAGGAAKCQPWDRPGERPAPLKVLGVWYSNNSAPPPLLQKSLGTIKRAADLSRADVRVVTCPWEPIPDNPFPETLATFKNGPGHLNIVRQQRQAIDFGRHGEGPGEAFVPDVVCFLEHDVLYPPDYFDRVAKAFVQNPAAPVVSNLDYEGLNAAGWLAVRERHEPLHQLSMRYDVALANLDRAEAEAVASGQCLLEPQGDRKDWARLPPRGRMPSVHVNH